ncbi:MAG: ribonuclease E activity regulator RraA [Candidatus Hydrogenedentes bacterium]|nr:ribonuclease E activity regulator RraA [Candidatus Hydrogenedentota bacterium]
MPEFKTTDLCDAYGVRLQVAELAFRDYGGVPRFCGVIETISAFEDNSRVRECVERPGDGKVLVIDGGGSLRRAMLGDLLAEKAVQNGWNGVLVNGCIRDAAAIGRMPLGVKALGANPRKTEKRGLGDHNVPVRFAGVTFLPGHFLYADEDGIIVSEQPLELSI